MTEIKTQNDISHYKENYLSVFLKYIFLKFIKGVNLREMKLLKKLLPVKLLSRDWRSEKARRAKTIFKEGQRMNKVFLLKKGTVGIYKRNKDNNHFYLIDRIKPGEYFGLSLSPLTTTYQVSAYAEEPVHYLGIKKSTFLEKVNKSPDLKLRLCQELSERLHQFEKRLFN